MKTIRLLLATALALATLTVVVGSLTWGQLVTARADGAVRAPTAPQTLPQPWLSDDDVADATYNWQPPTVDGRITPGEYAGAGKVTFPGHGGQVEVFFTEDNSALYIAFDLPATHAGGPNIANVYLDTDLDGDSSVDANDYWLRVSDDGTVEEHPGTASGWGSATPPIGWMGTVQSGLTGGRWNAEFRIDFTKLGIVPPVVQELGLALGTENGGLFYWPSGAGPDDPSSWGSLVSSSDWSTFYWKPGPWEDYAPSGVPDFDQTQVGSTYCGPFAAANSLWWFDAKFEPDPVGPPPGGPPATIPISDSYPLVQSYDPLSWDDHDPQNVVSLTLDLGTKYFQTDQGIPGTHIYNMYTGIQNYLRDHGLWDEYIVTLVNQPEFDWIAEEVMRSEDVILLLGFWQEQPEGSGHWVRIAGHYVTVAGVNPSATSIAVSDPAQDAAEVTGMGRVLSGTLISHIPRPGHPITTHTDAGNVSHDIYLVEPGSPSPGGTWWIPDYEVPLTLLEIPGLNPNPRWEEPPEPPLPGLIHTEIEYALAVSPYTWKASGRWVEAEDRPLYDERFEPYFDFAPSGVPDFDQKQDTWISGLQWTFCGPAAAANSLWWFDSKFEYHGAVPPTISDTYPLVETYVDLWDDHDPQNVGNNQAGFGAGLIEDLAARFQTDVGGAGTQSADLAAGLEQYLIDHYNLRQGYVITQVDAPDFWWVAEEVERSEDVILLLGFWQWVDPVWSRLGGHYVTVPGVDKQGGYVAFSDPYFDRVELALPPNEFMRFPLWTGRVGSDGDPPLGPSGLVPTYTHLPLPHTGVYTLHNDAANISHDVYTVISTDSPGGVWGPSEYVDAWAPDFVNFEGQNGDWGPEPYSDTLPVATEVESAVAVSPVADVWVRKTIEPGTVVPGGWVTFTIQFGNAGNTAEDVVISDLLPSELTNASATYSLNYSGQLISHDTYTWTVGTLHWMEGGTITVTAQVDPTLDWLAETDIANNVEITTATQEQYQVPAQSNSDSASFTVQTTDLEISKSVTPATLRAGDELTYTIVYTNHGPAPAASTVITDLLDSWLVSPNYTLWTSYGVGMPTISGTYVWSMGDVPDDGWGIITVTAQVSPSLSGGGTLPNTVSASTATPERDYTNNDDSAAATVVYYGVDLRPDSGSLTENPGQTVTYTLAAHNTGNVAETYDVSGVVSGLPWTTVWPASVGPVAAGGNTQFEVTVEIPGGAPDETWSQVVITTTSQQDGSQWDASPLTTYAQSGTLTRDVAITATTTTISGDPGATVCLTVTVGNTGSVTDTVDVSHTFPVSWTMTMTPPPAYALGPGEERAAKTCITIPTGASAGSTQTGTMTVTSQGDPSASADVDITVHVGQKLIYLPIVVRNYP